MREAVTPNSADANNWIERQNKLRFRTLRLHVSSVLWKDPEVSADYADIGLSVQVCPENEERNGFSLTNGTIVGRVVLERGKEMGGKVINSSPGGGNRRHLVQIVEKHSVICVLYSFNGFENLLVDGWMMG